MHFIYNTPRQDVSRRFIKSSISIENNVGDRTPPRHTPARTLKSRLCIALNAHIQNISHCEFYKTNWYTTVD